MGSVTMSRRFLQQPGRVRLSGKMNPDGQIPFDEDVARFEKKETGYGR
jgi:hypothetical protein